MPALEELLRRVCTSPDSIDLVYEPVNRMWSVRVQGRDEKGSMYAGTFESPVLYNALNAARQKLDERKRPFRPRVVK